MGIESDQVVYEYLSRVGDLAQQRQLPSSTRMRLVSGLRDEIDRRRAKAPVDSPAAVRRIIARLGTPDEVVEAAGAPGDVPEPPAAAVPVQRVTGGEAAGGAAEAAGDAGERAKGLSRGLRRVVPRPRSADAVTPPVAGGGGAAPPHLAPLHELGEGDAQPDWWRVGGGGGPGGDIGFGLGDSVPGFVGGVEIPELLKQPPVKRDGDGGEAVDAERGAVVEKTAFASAGAGAAGDAEAGASVRRRRVPLPRLRPAGGGWSNPLLLLAAVLLVAGAVMGSLVPLGLGWLIAYLSRRLTPAESKWAVMGVPGVVATGGVVWLWGRSDGRWGDPIAQGQMSGALAETWPWVLRVAAVSSALYLLWRSQRPR